ncbi:MAG: ABC transporter substrate-binding protein [Lachnospiraceae bacterium]|nr:ABC transporter substrate-binding protein [Lachnospiraceae bacterium]
MMKRNNAAGFRMANALLLTIVLPAALLSGCGNSGKREAREDDNSNVLYVYNWGEYIDPDVIGEFEEETGYKVVYDVFETNEVMYPKIAADPSQYDVICPSDYMIERMAQSDLLSELDFDAMPNASANIGKDYWEMSRAFDPENKYSVPYTWGTVGILYNTTMVDGEIDSWDVLWDPAYNDNILMQDSVRDLFMVAEKKLGYSLNTTDKKELEEARDLLIQEKPLVQAYVVDEVRDKMISGEAAIGVIYSGEAEYTREENEDLAYCVPKEGTNVWIDSWVITKQSRHKKAAAAWIDYMCRGDVALKNFEYIYYSTPNTAAMELMDEETLSNEVLFPDVSKLQGLEAYKYLGTDADRLYYNLWKEIKSS